MVKLNLAKIADASESALNSYVAPDLSLTEYKVMGATGSECLPSWVETMPSKRLLGGDTSSKDILHTLATWLDNYNHLHKCLSSESFTLPSKVLEVSENSAYLRDNIKEQRPYACVSHC